MSLFYISFGTNFGKISERVPVSVITQLYVSPTLDCSVDDTKVVSHWARFDLFSVAESQRLTQTLKSNWHICVEDLKLIFKAETLSEPNYNPYQHHCVGTFFKSTNIKYDL